MYMYCLVQCLLKQNAFEPHASSRLSSQSEKWKVSHFGNVDVASRNQANGFAVPFLLQYRFFEWSNLQLHSNEIWRTVQVYLSFMSDLVFCTILCWQRRKVMNLTSVYVYWRFWKPAPITSKLGHSCLQSPSAMWWMREATILHIPL